MSNSTENWKHLPDAPAWYVFSICLQSISKLLIKCFVWGGQKRKIDSYGRRIHHRKYEFTVTDIIFCSNDYDLAATKFGSRSLIARSVKHCTKVYIVLANFGTINELQYESTTCGRSKVLSKMKRGMKHRLFLYKILLGWTVQITDICRNWFLTNMSCFAL